MRVFCPPPCFPSLFTSVRTVKFDSAGSLPFIRAVSCFQYPAELLSLYFSLLLSVSHVGMGLVYGHMDRWTDSCEQMQTAVRFDRVGSQWISTRYLALGPVESVTILLMIRRCSGVP